MDGGAKEGMSRADRRLSIMLGMVGVSVQGVRKRMTFLTIHNDDSS